MKRIKMLLFIFICYFMFVLQGTAASSITVKSNRTSGIVVGNNITVTVTYYSAKYLSNIEGIVSYDNKVLKYVSGSNLAIDEDLEAGITTKTYTYTFKAIGSGTSMITVNGGCAYELEGSDTTCQKSSVTPVKISVITQAQLEATYSKNNNLSSLEVEGQTLSPEFNKDTLEYSVELENDVEKINVIAKAEDSKSSINGVGEVTVEEGNNKIEIKVTAQNGNEKIYVINAKVKELDPINVKVGNEEFSVVRKIKNLEKPNELFEESTVMINDTEVPSFTNSKAKITIIGLKDKDGDVSYYIYNNNKEFSKYNELKIGNLIIILKDMDESKLPDNYKEYNVTINKNKIKGYKYKASSSFYLINGINLETGKENLYVYDKSENTIQRYNDEVIKGLNNDLNNYIKYTIIGGSSVGGLIIIISVILIVKSRNNKKNNKNKTKKKLSSTKEFEI